MNGTSTELVGALMQTMVPTLPPWLPPPPQQAFPFALVNGNSQPPGPFYDVALQLVNDPLRCLEDLSSQYGSVVGFRLLTRRAVLISDPALAKDVLVSRSSTFIKETSVFPSSSLAGRTGLLLSHGDVWKTQRQLANPSFRKGVVHTYANTMVERTQEMVESKWSRGGVRDIYADVNDLTTRILASSLFGGPSGLEDMDELEPAITTVYHYFTRQGTSMLTGGQIMMTTVPEWVPTPHNLQYLSSISTMNAVVYRLISERREKLASRKSSTGQNAAARKDVLTQLLEARDEDGKGIDDDAVKDQLMTFLVAGQEASALVLTWTLVMLALHPEVQLCLYDEFVEVLGHRPPTFSDIPKLRYLEACISETLRLMPPAYMLARSAVQDTKVGRWDVPTGTAVFVSPYLVHRDPAQWPRANEFDPQRWLPGGSAQHSNNEGYYLPFGLGPRSCIGRNFAMMEVSLVLAIVVRRFWVGIPPGTPVPKPRAMITLRPKDEVELLLSKRREEKRK